MRAYSYFAFYVDFLVFAPKTLQENIELETKPITAKVANSARLFQLTFTLVKQNFVTTTNEETNCGGRRAFRGFPPWRILPCSLGCPGTAKKFQINFTYMNET